MKQKIQVVSKELREERAAEMAEEMGDWDKGLDFVR